MNQKTMSKLTDFYSHRDSLRAEDNAQWAALEDKLLNEEMLPELLQHVRTVLSQVKTPLSINISYDPNGIIAASFTRNCAQSVVSIDSLPPADTNLSEETEYEEVETPHNLLPEESAETNNVEEESLNSLQDSDEEKITRAKSVGFSVTFPDGTIIKEKKAVKTFIKALQKIGLELIANGNHGVLHKGVNVVSLDRLESDEKKQDFVDGYFIYKHMSNEDKIADLETLSDYYNLGLIINGNTIEDDSPREMPDINEDAKLWNLPVKQNFINYIYDKVARRTADGYLSILDNAVRKYIREEIDINADSIFSYTNAEDVSICIDILKSSPNFVADNSKRHNSMTAALNQYLAFVKDRFAN